MWWMMHHFIYDEMTAHTKHAMPPEESVRLPPFNSLRLSHLSLIPDWHSDRFWHPKNWQKCNDVFSIKEIQQVRTLQCQVSNKEIAGKNNTRLLVRQTRTMALLVQFSYASWNGLFFTITINYLIMLGLYRRCSPLCSQIMKHQLLMFHAFTHDGMSGDRNWLLIRHQWSGCRRCSDESATHSGMHTPPSTPSIEPHYNPVFHKNWAQANFVSNQAVLRCSTGTSIYMIKLYLSGDQVKSMSISHIHATCPCRFISQDGIYVRNRI